MIDFESLGPLQRAELDTLMVEAARRRRLRMIRTMFPHTGRLRRELYPKHLQFFAARPLGTPPEEYDRTKKCSERIFMAGNRVGKTMAAGTELVYHLTGEYPDWWVGHRFDRPVKALASGDTTFTTRDILQDKLLGGTVDEESYGTGLIPGERIIGYTKRQGVPGAVEMVRVRHASGGESELLLRSYEQGRKIFQGFELDIFWPDEECPQDVYEEGQVRLMTTGGISMLTFTPLSGLTPLVQQLTKPATDYTDEEDPDGLLRHAATDRLVIMCGWDDVPHLTAEAKAKLFAKLAPHQRDARTKGVPSLGAGAIYPVSEDDIVCDDFKLPDHFKHGYGLDVGWNRTAAVWGGYDVESDTIYVYAEHYRGQAEPSIHADAIKGRGAWKPGAVDPAARGRAQKDGEQLLQTYQDLGLDIITALNAVEAGIYEVWQRLSTGRLKIFRTCTNVLSEYRVYRRDEKGRIVKENDHAMDALRYLVMFLIHQSGGKIRPAAVKKATARVGHSWRTT